MSLLAGWRLGADIEIESEKFRKIGETRFILGTYYGNTESKLACRKSA